MDSTEEFIEFLKLNRDKEIVWGTHIDRSHTMTSEDFIVEDGKLFLDTYEGM